jgi:hypothetical protein
MIESSSRAGGTLVLGGRPPARVFRHPQPGVPLHLPHCPGCPRRRHFFRLLRLVQLASARLVASPIFAPDAAVAPAASQADRRVRPWSSFAFRSSSSRHLHAYRLGGATTLRSESTNDPERRRKRKLIARGDPSGTALLDGRHGRRTKSESQRHDLKKYKIRPEGNAPRSASIAGARTGRSRV